MNAYLFMFVFMVSLSAFAVGPQKEASASQCLHKAKQVAQALDQINGDTFAARVVTAEVVKDYEDASMRDVQVATYNFGDGESYLEVVIKPDYYRNGDCNFVSAKVISQD